MPLKVADKLESVRARARIGGRAEKAWLIRTKRATIDFKPVEPSACSNVLVIGPEEAQETTITKKEKN